ncbi:GGDEF domain-containing protein [uncultured Shewanella sp.]|uniref:GGDEF domain-containing protein n=1 Tax=uncultured Shewanella sp. TaxID=173975 RepID=UPI002607C236|nr:GGDEF domain-containing protein [uncultured Shewanella sp.]
MRYTIVILLYLFAASTLVNAEEGNYDATLTEIVDSLTAAPQKSTDLLESMLGDWGELSTEQRALVKIYQAILKIYDGDYQASIILLREAESFNPSAATLNKIYQYLSTNYIGLKDYPAALELMAVNLDRIEQANNTDIKVGSYIRLANLALELDAYQNMREYALEAMSLSLDVDSRQHCFALLYVAVADLKQQQYQNAENGFQRSQTFCEANQLPLIGLMSQKGLALVAINTENYHSAKNLLEPVLKGYQEFNFQTEINHVNALLSQTYLALEDSPQAEEFANKVMSLNDETSHIEYKAIATKVLSQRYFESKEYKLAYDYLESHQHYSHLILDDTKAKANAYQMAKFKHQEQAREIALLNQERQLVETQKELDQSARTNNVMIMTMLVGSVIFLSLFLFYSHRQKLRYRRLALTDRLTSVYNRGAGQDFAENEFIQVSMRKADYSVIVFDLDLFKNINDSFGHATGDWTLKHVVSVIRPLIRDSDIFTRMGGEEFALFLPYSSEQTALKIAERCKLAIAAIDTKYSGHVFNISASFGVSCNTREDLSLDPLLKRADIALYASKHSGRNRVTLYTPELKQLRPTDETQRSLVFN